LNSPQAGAPPRVARFARGTVRDGSFDRREKYNNSNGVGDENDSEREYQALAR
jgi:hypothetical protein